MKSFIQGRLRSFKYALKGFTILIKTEHSIITQAICFIVLIILGFILGISKQDWINQTLAMGLVFSIEGLNTTVEKLADFVHKEQHPKIGIIKDIAAGAVTFSVFTCVIVLAIIYFPYVF